MVQVKKSSFIGKSLSLSAAKITSMVLSLVTTMLLSRFRTLSEYGTYSQMLMVITLMINLFMIGLPNSINYFLSIARTEEDRAKFLSVYYTASTILSALIGLLLVLAVPVLVSYFRNPYIQSFIYFLALYPWTRIIDSSLENVCIVYGRMRFLFFFRLIHSITILGIIVGIQWLGFGFQEYMVCTVVAEICFTIFIYLFVRICSGKLRFSLNKEMIKKILVYSIPIGLASVAGTLKAEMDKLVIGWFYSTEELAIYTNAAKEMPITIIATSISAILIPIVVRLIRDKKMDKAVRLWKDTVGLSYYIMCYLAIGLFTFASEAMTFLYSEKYLAGVTVYRIYCIVLLFRSVYFGTMLSAIGKTRAILGATLSSLMINFVFNILFYYIFGFIGPALSTVLATTISAGIQLMFTCKHTGQKIRNIFPWKDILWITLLNAGFGAVFGWLKILLPLEQIVGSVLEAILLALVWGALLFLLTRKYFLKKWRILSRVDGNGEREEILE